MTTRSNRVDTLSLQPHPEGGYYRETFRSAAALPDGRACATSILFLLTADNPSNFHRLDAEEMWYYQGGDPLTVHIIDAAGVYSTLSIGPDACAGQVLQAVVPPKVWFGSSCDTPGGQSLVGCMVTPGFDFAGFELAERTEMLAAFPDHAAIIRKLTRSP